VSVSGHVMYYIIDKDNNVMAPYKQQGIQ